MSNDWLDNDPDIAETIDTMRRLHNVERPQPDASFVRNLEQSLMSNVQASASHPPSPGTIDWSGGEGRRWRPEQHPSFGRVSKAVTIAAVMLLIASATWFAMRDGAGRTDSRGTYAAYGNGTPIADTTGSEQVVFPMGVVWSLPLAEGERVGIRAVTIANGIVYRLVESSTFTGIEAIDAGNGSLIWQRSANWMIGGVSSTSRAYESIAADEHHVYYFSTPSRLQALDVSTGEEAWNKPMGGSGVTVTADNGQILVWDDTQTLNVFDAESGDHQWTFDGSDAETDLRNGGGPAVFDDLVIVSAGLGELAALDRNDGQRLWTYEDTIDVLNITIGGIQADGALSAIVIEAFGADQQSTTIDDDRRATKLIFALDPADGTVIWREQVFSSIGSNLAISGETVVQIVDNLEIEITPIMVTPESESGPPIVTQVVGRDSATGEIIWTHTGSPDAYFYYIGTGGSDIVIARENNGPTTILQSSDGTALCNLPDSVSVTVSHGLTQDGLVIASLVDGSLVALDPVAACAG